MDNLIIPKGKALKIFTDGAARRNPGPAASAFLLLFNDEILFKDSSFLGSKTNNQAEYQAIINALTKARELTSGKIEVYSDSQLVVKQLTGEYRINKRHLFNLNKQISELKTSFESVTFSHVYRTHKYIKIVDRLCNDCLDQNYKK